MELHETGLSKVEKDLDTPYDATVDIARVVDTPEPGRRHAAPFDPAALIIAPRHLRVVTGLSSVTIWRLRRAGLFPPPLILSVGRIGWRRSDIDGWLAERQQAGK